MNFTIKELAGLITSSVIAFFVFGNIFSKAGYPRWYGLLMATPFLNVAVLFWFAYAAWPIENDLLDLRFRSGK
jgi:hypothetical protein